jgi:drug/metabolite transporter (DMT)-like permease
MDWLTTRPSPDVANHWLALLSLVLFALGVIAAGYLSSRPGSPPFSGNFTREFVRTATTLVGSICGIGLFFGIIRLLQIDPATLGRPIWIVVTWIALVAAIGLLVSRAPTDRQLRLARRQRIQARKVRA